MFILVWLKNVCLLLNLWRTAFCLTMIQPRLRIVPAKCLIFLKPGVKIIKFGALDFHHQY